MEAVAMASWLGDCRCTFCRVKEPELATPMWLMECGCLSTAVHRTWLPSGNGW